MKKLLGLSVLFLLGTIFVSCTDYGDKVEKDKNEVFYKDGATEDEASALLDFLVDKKFFTPGQHNSAQLTKNGDAYVVRMVVKEGFQDKPQFIASATLLGQMIAGELFEGSALEVHLCDDHFETLKKIDIDGESADKVIDRDDNQVIYANDIDEQLAETLFSYLRKEEYFQANRASTVRIRKENELYEIDFMVKDGIWEDESYVNKFEVFSQSINEDCFDSQLDAINLCSTNFDIKKRIEP